MAPRDVTGAELLGCLLVAALPEGLGARLPQTERDIWRAGARCCFTVRRQSAPRWEAIVLHLLFSRRGAFWRATPAQYRAVLPAAPESTGEEL